MKRWWFSVFVLLSLVFLVVYLTQTDYLAIPSCVQPESFLVSVALLFTGFVAHGITWFVILRSSGQSTSLAGSYASVGLSVFGKYIPGKIWVVLGRAAYVARLQKHSTASLASLSLDCQIITVWIGLLLGIVGLLPTPLSHQWLLYSLLGWTILSLYLFTDYLHNLVSYLVRKALRRQVSISRLNLIEVIKTTPWFLINWLCWCVGFYFLVHSLYPYSVNILAGLGFALAATVGILAIIFPGGLGVREGILTAYLIAIGLDEKSAVSIAVASRLWFLLGEVFIFLLGFIAHRRNYKESRPI